MHKAPSKQSAPRRGIYLLPNLITTGGMLAGFYAIIASINAQYAEAAMAVFVAAILDGLDGRIARLTNTQSEFGVQYDSLADLVSFGLAPSLIMFNWSLMHLKTLGPVWGKLGWAAAFLYAACAALRLARFNTQVGVIDKQYFQGLASPAAAGLMMAFVWTLVDMHFSGAQVGFLALGVTVASALLMVSRIRYYSFKSLPFVESVPFLFVLLALLILILLAIDPPRVLLAMAGIYVVSGPLITAVGLYKRRKRKDIGGKA